MTRARAVVDGAFFAAVTVLLFLAYKLPVLGVVGDLFCPVPVLYIGVRHGLRTALLTLAVATLLLLWADPLFALIFVFTFGATGVALGECLRRRARWSVTLLAGGLVSLLLMAPTYALAREWSELNLVAQYSGMVETIARQQHEQLLLDAGQAADAEARARLEEQARLLLEMYVPFVKVMPPTMILGLIFLSIGINLGAARWLLRRVGTELPPLPAFRSFRCWDACVWGLIFGLGLLLLRDRSPEWWAVGMNLAVLFGFLYLLQGVAVAVALLTHWGVSPPVRILGALGLALTAGHLVALVGVFDTWFDFRARWGPPAALPPPAPPGPRIGRNER